MTIRPRGAARALLAASLPLALTALLAACDSSNDSTSSTSAGRSGSSRASSSAHESETSPAGRPGTVQSVECPGKAKAVALPEGGVPAPLPEGVVVVDVRGPVDGLTVVTGVVPRAERAVLSELQDVYPSAGLALSQGETEERDAESNFAGNGVEGRWGVRELSDCSPAATRIDLVYRATG